jgi:hypothetical protein
MKYHPLIRPRTTLGIIFGMALASGVITSPARADLWDKRTILTVNQTIQVTDTVLQPGQYVLRLLDSQVDRHVVQIFNRDQTQIIDTVIAIPRQRNACRRLAQPIGAHLLSGRRLPEAIAPCAPGSIRATRSARNFFTQNTYSRWPW